MITIWQQGLLALLFGANAVAQDRLEWEPMFNGTDLSGWHRVNCAPSTWTVRNEMIVCSGKPRGVLCSDAQYENFELELEWQITSPGGKAGLLVWSDALPARGSALPRSIEIGMSDGLDAQDSIGHGDVFSVQGAQMTPERLDPAASQRCRSSENRVKPAGEWNQYRITCHEGTIAVAVNGKQVSAGHDISPRKGSICLASHGSPWCLRNVRVARLPPAKEPLATSRVAQLDRGFRSLYDGTDLSGWMCVGTRVDGISHWHSSDWILESDGHLDALWTERAYDDFELLFDWRGESMPTVLVRDGVSATAIQISTPNAGAPNEWHRVLFRFEGKTVTTEIDGMANEPSDLAGASIGAHRPIALQPSTRAPVGFTNVFVRELRRDAPR